MDLITTFLLLPSHARSNKWVRAQHTYPLSSDEIVRKMRPDKELGHDAA